VAPLALQGLFDIKGSIGKQCVGTPMKLPVQTRA
jgi:hypothetical protein